MIKFFDNYTLGSCENIVDEEVEEIANYTHNTWQANRSKVDILKDTKVGKIAEFAVTEIFKNLNILNYYPYDNIRLDDFKYHAPFDGIFTNNYNSEIAKFIYKCLQKDGAKLSANSLRALFCKGVLTLEIKSTRISEKYKNKTSFISYNDESSVNRLVEYLRSLDYITYPHLCRYGDMTFEKYCDYAENKLHTGLKGQALYDYIRDFEISCACDYYIRVFIDEEASLALVMGFIDKYTLLTPPETHKLIMPGKSEVPLYFVKKIKNGYNIKDIKGNIEKKLKKYKF